ncbi:MAG: GGDEF domain-containing protein, partial [Zymomonas mobilis]
GVGIALLILLGLYLIVLFRTFLLKRQTKRLQNLVNDRTFELQQANQQLSELANTDVLTGLLNRRALMAKLSELRQTAPLNEKTISIAMLDVDHFKKINDRYGHLVGDEVMRNAAFIIRNNIRQDDFAGRYGGDEFIIAISAPLEISRNIAERIRQEFTRMVVKNGDTELKITVSIGLFEMTTEDAVSAALDKADNLLYWAKNNGRNRVES